MLVVPVLGGMTVNAEGKSVPFQGVERPALRWAIA